MSLTPPACADARPRTHPAPARRPAYPGSVLRRSSSDRASRDDVRGCWVQARTTCDVRVTVSVRCRAPCGAHVAGSVAASAGTGQQPTARFMWPGPTCCWSPATSPNRWFAVRGRAVCRTGQPTRRADGRRQAAAGVAAARRVNHSALRHRHSPRAPAPGVRLRPIRSGWRVRTQDDRAGFQDFPSYGEPPRLLQQQVGLVREPARVRLAGEQPGQPLPRLGPDAQVGFGAVREQVVPGARRRGLAERDARSRSSVCPDRCAARVPTRPASRAGPPPARSPAR